MYYVCYKLITTGYLSELSESGAFGFRCESREPRQTPFKKLAILSFLPYRYRFDLYRIDMVVDK